MNNKLPVIEHLILTQKLTNEYSKLLNTLKKYYKFLAKTHKHIEWQNVDKYIWNNNTYNIYDIILSELNNFKKTKIQFMENEFNKHIKYCDYAEEQCIIQEKLLLSVIQMNKYYDGLNDIIETIITEPIQKHICLINIVETIITEPIQKHICLINIVETIITEPIQKHICCINVDIKTIYLSILRLMELHIWNYKFKKWTHSAFLKTLKFYHQ
jgi:hypothetical protein